MLMRFNTVALAAALSLSFTSLALAQGVPGGGGSGGNFQSQPDVPLTGLGSRDFDGPASTGSLGSRGPVDLGDADDDGDDGEDLVAGAQNRDDFAGSGGRTIERR